jgi:hypothetical protein
MTEHLHGKGETGQETQGHRPPTQQAGRREHARQPEGPTGERRGPPAEMVWGGENDHDWGKTGIGGL